jgi:hypothetical protein
MNPIDFWVRGSKVKVALPLYVKTVFYKKLDNPWTLDPKALQMHCFWSEDDLNGFLA